MRIRAVSACLLGGLVLATTGFLLAAPVGVPTSALFSNPQVEFAPAIFILGIVLAFSSAVLYELLPDR